MSVDTFSLMFITWECRGFPPPDLTWTRQGRLCGAGQGRLCGRSDPCRLPVVTPGPFCCCFGGVFAPRCTALWLLGCYAEASATAALLRAHGNVSAQREQVRLAARGPRHAGRAPGRCGPLRPAPVAPAPWGRRAWPGSRCWPEAPGPRASRSRC